jgi:hypothetical protein
MHMQGTNLRSTVKIIRYTYQKSPLRTFELTFVFLSVKKIINHKGSQSKAQRITKGKDYD